MGFNGEFRCDGEIIYKWHNRTYMDDLFIVPLYVQGSEVEIVPDEDTLSRALCIELGRLHVAAKHRGFIIDDWSTCVERVSALTDALMSLREGYTITYKASW